MTESLSPQILDGWALRNQRRCFVARPASIDALRAIVDEATNGGTHPVGILGGGQSFGDAAINGDGRVIDVTGLNAIIDVDDDAGILTAQPGLTLDAAQAAVASHGWLLPTVPGASQATLGGCIAFDVHGKNHETQGTFGANVLSMSLLTGDGTLQSCTPNDNAELFWATVGGMGLTGVITAVTIKLIPIETTHMIVRFTRTRDLSDTLAHQNHGADEPYSVTWVDTTAPNRAIGRGIVMTARHATIADLPARLRPGARLWPNKAIRRFTPVPAGGWIRPSTVRVFNTLFYARPRCKMERQSAHPYLFPLHGVGNINAFYGTNGFFEYQIVVPEDVAEPVIRNVLVTVKNSGMGSFLTAIKRFGPANPAPMSFPMRGLTLSVQVMAHDRTVEALFDDLDRRTAEAGGRVYLAKDSRLGPDMIDTMYPRRAEWAATVAAWDPNGLFTSEMCRRLNLRDT